MGCWKLETDVGPDGLPRFLRDLADALEAGPGAGGLAGLPVRELRKLVLVAACRGEGFRLALKAKRSHEVRVPTKKSAPAREPRPDSKAADPRAADAGARQREKYRQLKKAMQADYKALRKAAEAGLMPSQDALESFLALGESMAGMPQPLKAAGAEAAELARANAAFLEDARALRRAVSARDATALLEVLSRLERRKSACHAQFRS